MPGNTLRSLGQRAVLSVSTTQDSPTTKDYSDQRVGSARVEKPAAGQRERTVLESLEKGSKDRAAGGHTQRGSWGFALTVSGRLTTMSLFRILFTIH